MILKTRLAGKVYEFGSVKEVMAKANEQKSGDVLAGLAAASDSERVAAKEVLSNLLMSDLRNSPAVAYEEDDVTRMDQDGVDSAAYNRIKNWTVGEFREWLLSYQATAPTRTIPSSTTPTASPAPAATCPRSARSSRARPLLT